MSQRIYKAIEGLLTVLMAHIIKWVEQPEKRSKSWSDTIEKTRIQITDYQESKPSANLSFLLKIWDKALIKPKNRLKKK